MAVKVREIQAWLESRFPPCWAEEWDQIGLQLGDPDQPVRRIGVALEASPGSVSWAVTNRLDLIISHHPLFFAPIRALTSSTDPGPTALTLIRGKVALLVAHTNLDAAPEGVSTALALRLGLAGLVPLEKKQADLVKLVVFIPLGYEEKIASLLDFPGVGRIGSYRGCSFKVRGEGTFLPEEGSRPFKGHLGQRERVAEWRLEVQVERNRLSDLLRKIRLQHPYEEMAYDVTPLENRSQQVGIGRVGHFDPPCSWESLVKKIKQEVEAPSIRVSGKIPGVIQKVAVCGGSGGKLIPAVLASRADVFISGEIGYHPVVALQGKALTLIEIGHYPSEKWVLPSLRRALSQANRHQGWGVEVKEFRKKGDPYSRYY